MNAQKFAFFLNNISLRRGHGHFVRIILANFKAKTQETRGHLGFG